MPHKHEMDGLLMRRMPAMTPVARTVELPRPANEAPARFEFWRGASGKRYIHTVYSLLFCPAVSDATYVLIRREADGSRKVLRIGRTLGDEASLNLAEIRQRGAALGANEVHVHLIATSNRDRAMVEFDLQARAFTALTPEPARAH